MEENVDEGAMAAGNTLGRRPLAMPPNKSQMLNQIRNSLIHLHKDEPALSVAPAAETTTRPKSLYQNREITKSTPNLFDNKVTSNEAISTTNAFTNRSSRYKHKEMQSIRQSLKDFQINDGSDGHHGHNGYLDTMADKPVNELFLQHLIRMGYQRDMAMYALKYTENKGIEDAKSLLIRLSSSVNAGPVVNGFTKINTSNGPIPYDQKAQRPIIDGRYQTRSPVNSLESSSVRSESPSLSSSQGRPPQSPDPRWNTAVPSPKILTPPHPHGYQRRMSSPSDRLTPPPLPPRRVPTRISNSRPATPPPPVPPQTYKEANQRTQQTEQLKRRLSPAVHPSRDAFRPAHNPPVMGNGPITPHNAAHSNNNNMLNSSGGMRSPGYRVNANNNMSPIAGYPGQMGMDSRGVSPNISQMMFNNQEHQQQQSQYMHAQGQVLSDTSPLSSNSPSPAPTPSPGAMVQNYAPQHIHGRQNQGAKPPPVPVQAWGAKQTPIVLQKVQSKEVHKPVLQTATAPVFPPNQTMDGQEQTANYVSSVQAHVNDSYHNMQGTAVDRRGIRNFQIEIRPSQTPPHGYQQQQYHGHHHNQSHLTQHTQHHNQHPHQQHVHAQQRTINVNCHPQGPNIHIQHTMVPGGYGNGHLSQHYSHTPHSPKSESPVQRTWSPMSTNSAPSTNSDIPCSSDKPPPPYPGGFPVYQNQVKQFQTTTNYYSLNTVNIQTIPNDDRSDTQSNAASESSRLTEFDERNSTTSEQTESSSNAGGERTYQTVSPKPERRANAAQRDAERIETKVRTYSPEAYKFFMEQHIENVLKSSKQRELRRTALEREMDSCKLTEESKQEMRKMLFQKESNHNRLKRAKMDRTLFDKITTLGNGAFGEVSLVRKKDTGYLYAMKTLRKNDVLERNQVAHVKAERDILAEADCEWVVKLYYSFQDKRFLYFIMDYIPGGDMMSLLIKLEIFEEALTRFYIAELVLAIESVHNMGFIHRDIKPDNILIDKDGHIKLTDFGLCTGFRWTHNSKYYQRGNHARQDSMEPFESNHVNCDCHDVTQKEILKPLERRKLRHQRCQAHSLVGTPNYIAPEVVLRQGYTRCCDWWSVGVIMYEMLVGSPPFLAGTPQDTQRKVVEWQRVLKIPREANLSAASSDLILRLLTDEQRRLGRHGAGEIKEHPFFQPIKFEGLRQTTAPFIPKIRCATDTSNFDPVEENKFNSQDSRRDGTLERSYPEHAFYEFTFKRFFDEGGHAMAMKIPSTNGDDSNPVFV